MNSRVKIVEVPDKFRYRVLVDGWAIAAFLHLENAERFADDLRKRGY